LANSDREDHAPESHKRRHPHGSRSLNLLFGYREGDGRSRVVARERDDFFALCLDGHAGHNCVVFLGEEGRDDAVPGSFNDLAFDLHAFAQLVGKVDVEANQVNRPHL
tara:strand:- start:8402 stop:8725 length:324 start_codon:yes stop_codon:yes gene_type:complete